MINYSICSLVSPLKPEEGQKSYARAQMSELMPFSKFVEHITNHNGVFTRGTVRGVIVDMCECLVEMLLDGKKVQLDELGDFSVSLSSTPTDSPQDFTAANIKAVNIVFSPGDDFQNLISRAQFNVVSSRAVQTATLKAEKSGASTIDLEAVRAAAKKKSSDKGSEGSGSDSSDTKASGSDTSNGGTSTSGGNTGGGQSSGGSSSGEEEGGEHS